MMRHVFRLVWNRRKENGLIVVELFVSFLILCGLFTAAATYAIHWMSPRGFDYQNVWRAALALGPIHQYDEERIDAMQRTLVELERGFVDHPDVESVSVGNNIPYVNSRRITSDLLHGERVRIHVTDVGPSYSEVLGLELVDGRWFEESDYPAAENLVVMTEGLARMYFGNESAVGHYRPDLDEHGEPQDVPEEERRRIIGVVKDTKINGEHQQAHQHLFFLYDPAGDHDPPRNLLVRVRPGSGGQLEADLDAIARRVAPGIQVSLSRLPSTRSSYMRSALTPLVAMMVVAGFLVVMVGLGLIGVLWQNVARRRNEIGLRRALGATAGGAQLQILGELFALSTLAVVAGTAVYVQLPLLGVFEASWPAITLAVGAALGVLFGFVLICGLYPSWLASRVQPAVALMYE